MNGFESRKQRKNESIRQAALELFKTYGFKKVSINDIAHKAGVSQVTIYNHFGSKQELVRDVVKTLFTSMIDKYRAIINGEGSFTEKLESIVFDKTEIASHFQGQLTQALFQSDPEMEHFVDDWWKKDVVPLTIDLIEKGKNEGYINPELSREVLLLYLSLLRSGVSARPDLLANVKPNIKLYRELNYIFLYGMMGKKE